MGKQIKVGESSSLNGLGRLRAAGNAKLFGLMHAYSSVSEACWMGQGGGAAEF